MDSQARMQLAQKFAPRVIFHPKEKYFPSSVEFFLANAKLCTADRKIVLSNNLTARNILDPDPCNPLADSLDWPTEQKLYLYQAAARKGDLSNAPCYFIVRTCPLDPSLHEIVYLFFYPYNGCLPWILGTSCVGTHEGDWEHVTIRVEGNTFIAAYFSAHDGEGCWYGKQDNLLSFHQTGRLNVFSAKESHASYPYADKIDRDDRPDDLTGNGQVWDTLPKLFDVSNKVSPTHRDHAPGCDWLRFSGRWGFTYEAFTKSPHGPAFQSWWLADEAKLGHGNIDFIDEHGTIRVTRPATKNQRWFLTPSDPLAHTSALRLRNVAPGLILKFAVDERNNSSEDVCRIEIRQLAAQIDVPSLEAPLNTADCLVIPSVTKGINGRVRWIEMF